MPASVELETAKVHLGLGSMSQMTISTTKFSAHGIEWFALKSERTASVHGVRVCYECTM